MLRNDRLAKGFCSLNRDMGLEKILTRVSLFDNVLS